MKGVGPGDKGKCNDMVMLLGSKVDHGREERWVARDHTGVGGIGPGDWGQSWDMVLLFRSRL